MGLVWLFCMAMILSIAALPAKAALPANGEPTKHSDPIKKVLFLGDSMTGWLAEALNGYGKINGFEVATIVWDGSTIMKWASSPALKKTIDTQNPDAVFISLGMNELFEKKPETRLGPALRKILQAVGDRKLVWVGPPSWPGQKKGTALNDWLAKELGSRSFFRSYDLMLPRQGARNPHPTRQGMIQWVDSLVNWISDNPDLEFPSLRKPEKERMVRGRTFIYKRMKEKL